MANQLDKLLAQQERATQKKHEAEQQKKRLKKQISDLKNKERTHRLCTRGAFLEKLLQEPEERKHRAIMVRCLYEIRLRLPLL